MIGPKTMDAMIRVGKQWDAYPSVRPFWFLLEDWNGKPTIMLHVIGRHAMYRIPFDDGCEPPEHTGGTITSCGLSGLSMTVDEMIRYRKENPRQPLKHPRGYAERLPCVGNVYPRWRSLWDIADNPKGGEIPSGATIKAEKEAENLLGEIEWTRVDPDAYGAERYLLIGRSNQGECLLQFNVSWKDRNPI